MTSTKTTEGPSPQLFFQTVNGHMRTAALSSAIELDVFSAIGEGHDTPSALEKACKGSARGFRMLCDYLTVAGFLTKQEDRYRLTPDSRHFLTKSSPAYLGPTLDFLLSQPLVEGMKHLAGAVRKGGTMVGEEGTVAPEHPEWVTFARSMVPLMKGPAEWMAQWVKQHAPGARKVLDVAAGHGIFGIEIARALPQVEVTAQDWRNVLAVARENAQAAGVIERFHELPGNAFEVEMETDYDIILLTNFLHHFDVATCERFLQKLHRSLKAGGLVLTLEFVPNEDRISPPSQAEFSLIMLATTPGGDAYVFSEYERMFQHAGFTDSRMQDIPASNERIIITRKS